MRVLPEMFSFAQINGFESGGIKKKSINIIMNPTNFEAE